MKEYQENSVPANRIAFVAYGSQDHDLLVVMRSAVSHANAKLTDLRLESWEYNDIPGQPLTSPILERNR